MTANHTFTTCTACAKLGPIDAELHDMLLEVENGGPAAVVRLFDWAEGQVGDPHVAAGPLPVGQIHTTVLGQFWALHDESGDLGSLAELQGIVSEYVTMRELAQCPCQCEGVDHS